METKKLHPHFECKKCVYVTNRKSSYDRHLLSKKHTNNQLETKPIICHNCNKCGKEYKTQSGAWKHRKTCNSSTINTIQQLIESNKELSRIVLQQQQIFGEMFVTST
jgi:hypothetical protein